jgi:hypothetical protein
MRRNDIVSEFRPKQGRLYFLRKTAELEGEYADVRLGPEEEGYSEPEEGVRGPH